jgi:hypothetical protein
MLRPRRLAVDKDRRGDHHAIKIQKNSPPCRVGWDQETLAIPTDEAVFLLGKVMVRQFDVGVRDADGDKRGFVASRVRSVWNILWGVEPVGGNGAMH